MNFSKLHKSIVSSSNIDKKWPKQELLAALNIPTMVQNSVCQWYLGDQKNMTLAELFDLVISDDKDLREGYLISPLLEIKYVGKKGFFDTIKSLSKVKFENKCKIKWMEKYKKFLNCYRVKGSHPYSWSFAVNKEGEKMAKFKCGTIYLPRHRKKYTIQESNNFNTPQKETLRPTAWPAGNTTAA